MSLEEFRRRAWRGLTGRTLTLLVGSNPLPNLVTALALAPDEIALLCSSKTAGPTRLLIDTIREVLPGIRCRQFQGLDWLTLADAHRPDAIRSSIRDYAASLSQTILAYTAGTKTMATHVHGALSQAAGGTGCSLRACYLSDADGLLMFDDGFEWPVLAASRVRFGQLARLHGLADVKTAGSEIGTSAGDSGPTTSDAKLLWDAVSADPSLAGRYFAALTVPETRERIRASDIGRQRSPQLSPIPDLPPFPAGFSLACSSSSLSAKKADRWIRFLRGTWLELVAASLLQRAKPERETVQDIQATLTTGRRFQLDVAQVAGPRLYAMSCTTGGDRPGDRGHTKLKVFEVVRRAKQLGGGLARSAVVSLHSPGCCREIENELEAAWLGDEPTPRVFGIEDLRAWDHRQFHSLVSWLES